MAGAGGGAVTASNPADSGGGAGYYLPPGSNPLPLSAPGWVERLPVKLEPDGGEGWAGVRAGPQRGGGVALIGRGCSPHARLAARGGRAGTRLGRGAAQSGFKGGGSGPGGAGGGALRLAGRAPGRPKGRRGAGREAMDCTFEGTSETGPPPFIAEPPSLTAKWPLVWSGMVLPQRKSQFGGVMSALGRLVG